MIGVGELVQFEGLTQQLEQAFGDELGGER